MQPVVIDLGQFSIAGARFGLRIYGYGLMLVLGFLCGIALARWRAGRFGEDPSVVATLGLLALAGGVLGSRAAYVIENWRTQYAWRADPLPEMLNITSGGLIYYGGVALATLAILGYLRLRRLPLRRYLDIIVPSMMLGLAFGRMGCTLNGCCYGGRCGEHFPLAVRFPYARPPLLNLSRGGNLFGAASVSPVFAHQVATPVERGGLDCGSLPDWLWRRDPAGGIERREDGSPVLKPPSDLSADHAREALALRSLPVQPAQVYGIVNALVIAAVLLGFSRLRRREGELFPLMLIMYPITRFVLEGIRGDNPHNLLRMEWTHNQYTSAGMVVLGVVLLVLLRWAPATAGPTWHERLAAERGQGSDPVRTRKGR